MSTTSRWSTIIGIGAAATLVLSIVATLTTDDPRTLTFTVFAVVMAPICIGSTWAFFPSDGAKGPTHPEDTVETEWSRKAGFGAFTDLIFAMGIAIVAHYVFDAPEVPLPVFIVLGFADFAIRYWAASRAHN